MSQTKKKKRVYLFKAIRYLSLAYFLFWVGKCSHVIYELSRSALPAINFPVPLKADGATYEFEYIPPKASLRRQTLFLYIDNNDYHSWKKKLNLENQDGLGYIFTIQMKIYHQDKQVFENIYSYKNTYSSHFIYLGKEQNYKKIDITEFSAFDTKYPNDYFKFKSGEKYKIVLKDLCTDPEIKHLRIYLGLDGAPNDRLYKFRS